MRWVAAILLLSACNAVPGPEPSRTPTAEERAFCDAEAGLSPLPPGSLGRLLTEEQVMAIRICLAEVTA